MRRGKHFLRIGIILFLMVMGFCLQVPSTAYGYPVPPLPEDNLITNPWFRSSSDPTTAGLDGWTPVLQDGIGWGISQKASNPSPDIIINGKCGFNENYCGTGARWANDPTEQDNFTYPGLDVYLYQVVEANAAHRKLKFFTYWVNHKVDVTEVKIYSSDSAEGQWAEVWLPFSLSQDQNPPPELSPGRGNHPWFYTDFLETTLGEGYPYYKIEIHARYPESRTRQGDVGVKITGVYFATEFTNEPESLSTPVMVHNPTVSPYNNGGDQSQDSIDPEETAVPEVEQGTPHRVRTQSPTPTPDPLPSEKTLSDQVSPTAFPTRQREGETEGTSNISQLNEGGVGFVIGMLAGGLLMAAFLFIWKAVKPPRL